MMKRFGVVLVGALAALSLSTTGYAEAAKAKAAAAGKAVLWAAEDMKWADLPDAPVKRAVLWGDPATGAHGALLKFPAGFEAPLHHHTADHHAVVVSGTMIITPEGEAGKRLGPGSSFSFTGKKKHTTGCDAASECVLFLDDSGRWDLVMADAKMAAPKK
jgi:quercetin dioxygenase-like cupin family protein